MAAEMDGLDEMETWTKMKTMPKGKRLLKTRWVFTRKWAAGKVVRYKARFVVKGYDQRPGDYGFTASPTPDVASIRMLIAMAAEHNWDIRQVDIVQAFLYADVQEELYVKLPDGYGRLRKALYGLVQAPRNWNDQLVQTLLAMGFERYVGDPCVLRKLDANGNVELLLIVWVDDILVTGNKDTHVMQEFINKLGQRYKVKDLGRADVFLGIKITWSEDGELITMSQRDYINTIMQRFFPEGAGLKKVTAPAMRSRVLSSADSPTTPEDIDFMADKPYSEAVGALLWVARMTRPDIMEAVRQVCGFMINPGKRHWEAVVHIFSFLYIFPDMGLTFGGTGGLILLGYVDADYATCLEQRRSVTGFAVLLAGAAISYGSKRQSIVAQSTTEAEYIGLAGITKEINFLQQLQRFLEPKMPHYAVHICEDNQGAIKIADNPITTAGTKHIQIRFHAIREQIELGNVTVGYISTDLQRADILTKAVEGPIRAEHARVLMGLER